MELLEWKPSIATHIAEVDRQHQELFYLVNNIIKALEAESGTNLIKMGLDELIDYTIFHFNAEEEILLRKGYPYIDQHKEEHSQLTYQVLKFKGDMRRHNNVDSQEFVEFLRNWLLHHTSTSDLDYAEFFRRHHQL